MTTFSTRHRDQMRQLERLNANISATIAEEIEHTDISTQRHDQDENAMREVEAGTYPRAAGNRFGG